MDGGREGGGGAWNNRTSPSLRPRPPNVDILSSTVISLMNAAEVVWYSLFWFLPKRTPFVFTGC